MSTWRMTARIREAGVALLLALAVVHPAASQALTGQTSTQRPEAAKQEILATYGKLPLRFEANRGQSHPQVDFLARGSGYTLYLTGTEAVLVPRQGQGNRSDVLRMKLIGANPASQAAGLEKLPGVAHHFIGNDPTMWRTNIPTYAKVEYRDVYPGVTLVYYGNQGGLEYDFVLAPGADPGAIRVAFEGVTSLEVDARGDLVLQTARGEVRQRKPFIYQEVSGVRQEVSGGYVLRERNQIAFRVAAYDPKRPLVIDPVLSYSTYLGGSGADTGWAIAVWTAPDGSVTAYVAGQTNSTDFPAPAGGTSPTSVAGLDAFVAKLDPSGALLYTAYLGGIFDDIGLGIAVDDLGNAYVTGRTESPNFPTMTAFQSAIGGDADAFVTKLNPTGGLVYSTFLGGGGFDEGKAIAVDSSRNAYVTGKTFSNPFPNPFPTVNPLQAQTGGSSDAFVAKVNAGGSALMFSTYLGGSGVDAGYGIAVDSSGNVYVTGQTDSTNFPMANVPNAFQPASGGGADAFVTTFNATGSALVYSTYLGGSGADLGSAIAVDSVGNAYVTGWTVSPNFPTMSAFQPASGGTPDAFVTKLNASGTLAYSTYLGGSGADAGWGIAVDGSGNAFVTGATYSDPFPTVDPIQPTIGGNADAFVAKFNAVGSALMFSTYLGGSGEDAGQGIAVDRSGGAHVIGYTSSQDFRTQNPSQAVLGGPVGSDAFVAKIQIPDPQAPPVVPAPSVVPVPFAAFTLREFDLDNDDDGFELDALKARFTLGPGSNGIDLAHEEVTIQVGTASVTIPAGSFKQDRRGRFKYEGTINGVRVKASIRSRDGGSYTFEVKGEEVRRGGHHRRNHRDDEPSFWWWKRHGGKSAPVTVALTIGNDSGTTTWKWKASHRRADDRERDRERDD